MSIQMADDEKFLELLRDQITISEKLIDLGKMGVLSLKNQRFQAEANQRTIVGQEKEMAENKAAMDAAKQEAKSIIEMAKEEAQKIKNHALNLKAEAATLKTQAEKIKEDAERIQFEAKKGAVKV